MFILGFWRQGLAKIANLDLNLKYSWTPPSSSPTPDTSQMLRLEACTPDLYFFLVYSDCLAEGTEIASITEAFLHFWNRMYGGLRNAYTGNSNSGGKVSFQVLSGSVTILCSSGVTCLVKESLVVEYKCDMARCGRSVYRER